MDDLDRAQELEAQNIKLALQKRHTELVFTGQCHYCEASVKNGNFCDADCRDDFDQIKRTRR